MATPSPAPRKTSFVTDTNPDILRISPRPGGIIPIRVPGFFTSSGLGDNLFGTNDPDFEVSMIGNVSKEFRVQSALDTLSIGSDDMIAPNPTKDTMYMLAVAISGLIMLASNQDDIPEEYMRWTWDCLNCIRDDFGNHPPNVQGILNQLRLKLGWGTDGYNSPGDDGEGADAAAGADDVAAADEGEAGAEEAGEGGEEVPGEGEENVEGGDAPADTIEAAGDIGGTEAKHTVRTLTRVSMGKMVNK